MLWASCGLHHVSSTKIKSALPNNQPQDLSRTSHLLYTPKKTLNGPVMPDIYVITKVVTGLQRDHANYRAVILPTRTTKSALYANGKMLVSGTKTINKLFKGAFTWAVSKGIKTTNNSHKYRYFSRKLQWPWIIKYCNLVSILAHPCKPNVHLVNPRCAECMPGSNRRHLWYP